MTDPQFTAIDVAELPARVRTSSITDADRAIGATVAAILATGKAAKSGGTWAEKRKATDAGVKLAGIIRRLGTNDTTFPYRGRTSVRTLVLGEGSFTFAITPKADDDTAETPEAPAEGGDAPAAEAAVK